MKESKFLEFLKNSKHFKQHSIADNLTKSYWFKVNNSGCTVNAYLVHKDNDSELYRVRYYSKDPLDIEVRYMENLISFEEFFEIIPEEVREDIIFHLDFFR